MARKLLDYDPATGTTRVFHAHVDEEFAVEDRTDAEPLVKWNRALHNDAPRGWRGDLHHVASIPAQVYFALPKALREDSAALKRWLDSPDQRAFRVRPGRLS